MDIKQKEGLNKKLEELLDQPKQKQTNPLIKNPTAAPQVETHQSKGDDDFNVKVNNLDPNVDSKILLQFFKDKYTHIKIEAFVVPDKDTKQSLGYGRLKFP